MAREACRGSPFGGIAGKAGRCAPGERYRHRPDGRCVRNGERAAQCGHLTELIRDADLATRALQMLGVAAIGEGDLARARRLLEQAQKRFDAAGNLTGAATINLMILGATACLQGDLERAAAWCEEALEMAGKVGETWMPGWALVTVGLTLLLGGQGHRLTHRQRAPPRTLRKPGLAGWS